MDSCNIKESSAGDQKSDANPELKSDDLHLHSCFHVYQVVTRNGTEWGRQCERLAKVREVTRMWVAPFLLLSPSCLRKVPNPMAAGALCIKIAMKIISPREVWELDFSETGIKGNLTVEGGAESDAVCD